MSVGGAAIAGTPRKPTAKPATPQVDVEHRKAITFIRRWLDREILTLPGLTREEAAIVERLLGDLEASR